MQPAAIAACLAICVLLFVLAPKIRASIVGAILVLAGVAVFAVRLHHEGPYPFPGPMDLGAGCAALLAGGLLVRPPWPGRTDGLPWATRILVGLAPILFLLAFVAMGHEAEEVVVLRTTGAGGAVRETRLWIVDYEGTPWVVTGRGQAHDADLAVSPRVEIFRRGQTRCWMAERYDDRATIETLLQRRSDKYAAQRIAFGLGLWKHFAKWDDLEELAVAIRFTPCPADAGAGPGG